MLKYIKVLMCLTFVFQKSFASDLEENSQQKKYEIITSSVFTNTTKLHINKTYADKGAVFPLKCLNEKDVVSVQQRYLELCSGEGSTIPSSERQFLHLKYRWVSDLVAHPAILNAVKEIIGPNILVWTCDFSAKDPDTKGFFSWHQDFYYWNFKIDDISNIPIVTVWLSLFTSNQTNGGLQIIPASHKQLVSHFETSDPNNLLTRGQNVAVEVDESKSEYVELGSGEFSIHHPLTFHASKPNMSNFPRVGMVVRYLSPEVIPPKRPAYAWLVCGKDNTRNWDHVAPAIEHHSASLIQDCIDSVKSFTGKNYK